MVGAMPVNLIPKFSNGSMASHNVTEDSEIQVRIGSRIRCNDDFGTVKFIGEVHGYKGVWYGVEWDEASRGKHGGCLDDIEYFKTSKPGAGSFIRPNKIAPMKSCAEAITRYYGDREDETVAAYRRTVINEWKREIGAPFIELVGFEKVHQKQKSLLEVSVRDQNVAAAGDVTSVCPLARSLDVSRNLFSNWREVITLTAQLPALSELDVSKNRMAIDMSEETLTKLSIHMANLEKLNISMCEYEWADLLTLSRLWPNVDEIVAARNRIGTIQPPPVGVLANLTVLWLDGNPISSFDEVLNLGKLKRLKMLSINDCDIETVRFGDDPSGAKVDVFENLEVLFFNRNKINDWRSISELHKLKNLKKLYLLKNPIQATEDYDTGVQLAVAKIGNIQELNGSLITPELRRGAEYDYMNRHGAEWKLAQADPARREAFAVQHCRLDELIRKYGIPEDSLLEKRSKDTTLTSQLVELKLQDENGTLINKKFPRTMSVQKLVTLAQRLFKTKTGHTGTPKLYCLTEELQGPEIWLDNSMKDLAYYSIKSGDTILVRFR